MRAGEFRRRRKSKKENAKLTFFVPSTRHFSARLRPFFTSGLRTATSPSSSTMDSTGITLGNPSKTKSKPSVVDSRRSVNSSRAVKLPTRASNKLERLSSTPSTSESLSSKPAWTQVDTSPLLETKTSSISLEETTPAKPLRFNPSKVEEEETDRRLILRLGNRRSIVARSSRGRGMRGSRSTSMGLRWR